MTDRGQSNIVGVAVLLALTVASVGMLAAGVGSIIDGAAGGAQIDRVADRFATLLPAGTAASGSTGQLRLVGGSITTVPREFRVLNGSTIRLEQEIGAVVYRVDGRRVAAVGGAVIQGRPGVATLVRPPELTVANTSAGATVFLAVPQLTTTPTVDVDSGRELTMVVTTNATRIPVPQPSDGVAFETVTPTPLQRWYAARGLNVSVTDLDGDGTPSVVIRVSPGTELHVVMLRTQVVFRG